MATHSSVLAWRIPGTEGPGGLLSIGSHRIRHDKSDLAAAAANTIHNDNLEMDYRPKCKTTNYKTLRGKHRQNTQ